MISILNNVNKLGVANSSITSWVDPPRMALYDMLVLTPLHVIMTSISLLYINRRPLTASIMLQLFQTFPLCWSWIVMVKNWDAFWASCKQWYEAWLFSWHCTLHQKLICLFEFLETGTLVWFLPIFPSPVISCSKHRLWFQLQTLGFYDD